MLDAAFLRAAERERAQALAREAGVPFAIIDCQAPPAQLRERLATRRNDASEATAQVLDLLQSADEPLTAQERALVLA